MKITLAAPARWLADAGLDYVGEAGVTGDADDTVEVDEAIGRRLISEGLARIPDTIPSTHAELDAVAAAEGTDLSGATTVADKRAAVKAARLNRS